MTAYLPPAGIDDFSQTDAADQLRAQWHQETTDMLSGLMSPGNNRRSPLFYDHLADTSGVADSAPVPIPWNAFPLRLDKWFNPATAAQRTRMLQAADQLMYRLFYHRDGVGKWVEIQVPFRVQDEYCEWHVKRGADGVIQQLTYTCEPPEYWSFLARHKFPLLLKLYRDLLREPTLPKDDLCWAHDVYEKQLTENNEVRYIKRFEAGSYNPYNVWNTERGAIHLTHPANSLYAEMALASDSTLGWPVTPRATGEIDAQELMCCAGVGGINRSSDPLILTGVFEQARQGLSVALANPIGLYMSPFALDLLNPEGDNIADQAVRVVRASDDRTKLLRVEIILPPDADYTLDLCTLGGEAITNGGQVAKLITMVLFGVVKQIPGHQLRRIASCSTFCCPHPKHPQFKGTFGLGRGANCAAIPDADWQSETFDIPGNEMQLERSMWKAGLEGLLEPTEVVDESEQVKLEGRKLLHGGEQVEIHFA